MQHFPDKVAESERSIDRSRFAIFIRDHSFFHPFARSGAAILNYVYSYILRTVDVETMVDVCVQACNHIRSIDAGDA